MKKFVIVVAALTLSLSACKKTENSKSDLPPAAGEGAKPLPEIPDMTGKTPDPAVGGGSNDATPASSAVTGTLDAREQVAVAPKASGTLVTITVDENSKVKKGDLLFRLDSANAVLMKKSAATQLSGAKLQLKTAQREYDRISGLVAQNALPAAQLDQLEAQVDGAKVQIAAAQNSIAMANKQISDATVRSPLSGVVIKKLMSVGEYATMMPPSPVLIIQDQSSLEVKFHLPERSLSELKQGDPVTITVASLGITRAAKITQISPMVDPRTKTIELTAMLDNCSGDLRPGLSAEIALGAPASGTGAAPDCGKPGVKPAAAKSAPLGKQKPSPIKPAPSAVKPVEKTP
jgi:RND family efflux transporter MFP subunit